MDHPTCNGFSSPRLSLDNHRNTAVDPANQAHGVRTVHLRHIQIEKNSLRSAFPKHPYRTSAVSSLDNGKPFILKHVPDNATQRPVVICNKNRIFHKPF